MAKSKDHSELEALRGENRSLKKLAKQLQKQLRKAIDQGYNGPIPPEPREVREEKPKLACPECGKSLEVADLGIRTLHSCTGCDYRKAFKK
jgi:hypothetical protein